MAKQNGTGQAAERKPPLTPVADGLADQARDAEVEALARDILVALAPTHGGGYTPEKLTDRAFVLAKAFYQECDKRRAERRQPRP